MLVKRRISLSSTTVFAETLLRREDLAGTLLAGELLEAARLEINNLLAKAQTDAQQLKERALAEFWESTQVFVQALEDHHLTLQQDALASVEELLNLGLERLLDAADMPERVRALVRNLTDGWQGVDKATLSCHPSILDPLSEWIAASPFASLWQLKTDSALPPETLQLNHANGAFDIDWQSLRRGLLTNID
jgi:type III secretion protein L